MILDNYNAVIPDKAKELVMMLGSKVEGTEFNRSLGLLLLTKRVLVSVASVCLSVCQKLSEISMA